MPKPIEPDLKQRVFWGAREYGAHMVLYRNVVSERLGVNVTDMECLTLLNSQGIANPSELAKYTGLSSGATTAMLDRLEKGGLIERRPNPNDRRGTLIVLQKAGLVKIARWYASVRNAEDALISSYSEKELATLADFLEKLARIWDEERKKLQQG